MIEANSLDETTPCFLKEKLENKNKAMIEANTHDETTSCSLQNFGK